MNEIYKVIGDQPYIYKDNLGYDYTGKVLHEMLSRKYKPQGKSINNVVQVEAELPFDRNHDACHEMMWKIGHDLEKYLDGQEVQGIEVVLQTCPFTMRTRVVVRVGTRRAEWHNVTSVKTGNVEVDQKKQIEASPISADRILPD